MSWHDTYPHSLFASVLLLDGKIESWKVVNYPKKHPFDFKADWKRDRLNDYTCQWTEFVANDAEEHNRIFQELAPAWFKQWPHADDYWGFEAYV
jgi:hypothetical protein